MRFLKSNFDTRFVYNTAPSSNPLQTFATDAMKKAVEYSLGIKAEQAQAAYDTVVEMTDFDLGTLGNGVTSWLEKQSWYDGSFVERMVEKVQGMFSEDLSNLSDEVMASNSDAPVANEPIVMNDADIEEIVEEN